jgi:hypothetical protein
MSFHSEDLCEKKWTSKGSPLEPHLSCEKEDKKKILNYVISWWRFVKVLTQKK